MRTLLVLGGVAALALVIGSLLGGVWAGIVFVLAGARGVEPLDDNGDEGTVSIRSRCDWSGPARRKRPIRRAAEFRVE